MSDSILIITLPPLAGGVPDKAKLFVRHLRKLGYPVTVSHYATYKDYPRLVVTFWQIFSGKRPGIRIDKCFGDFPCVSIGCWFPEFEFTYYLKSVHWQRLINNHQRHIVISGTVLTSYVLSTLGIPHLVWCASTMIEDRIERQYSMPFLRRMFDRFVISPVQNIMEKKILRGNGRFMAVSSYTLKTLASKGVSLKRITRVPIPVDLKRFMPPTLSPRNGLIGFAGRPGDPRKNISLLFFALKNLINQGKNFELLLTGDETEPLEKLAEDLGIRRHITWTGWLNEDELPNFYQKLDIFVIPSTQEGLNIAGLQAMATAVPIVSTRCGGPEDYVIEGKTGALISADSDEMAAAILTITENRLKREVLGRNARQFVEENYNHNQFEKSLATAWRQTWGDQI